MYPCGCKLKILYGLPKDIGRPKISMMSDFGYQLSKIWAKTIVYRHLPKAEELLLPFNLPPCGLGTDLSFPLSGSFFSSANQIGTGC